MIDIHALINNARKAGNKVGLSVYQALLSELQKYETSKNAEPINDVIQIKIFGKYAKGLEDAISQFSEAGRDDLVAQYTVELGLVEELIPRPATGQELLNFIQVDEYFQKYKQWTLEHEHVVAIPKKDMGACIKYIKSTFPTADGKLISDIIKSYIY